MIIRPYAVFANKPFSEIRLTDTFWSNKINTLASIGIEHQRQMLEESHCVDNFRIAAGQIDHAFRVGFVYADSDLYKWVEAGCRILQLRVDARLERNVADVIQNIQAAQESDGYLFTFNTIHFPGRRWQHLQKEHELYCAGHLIEAAIARSEQGHDDLLEIAIKLADRIVLDFSGMGLEATPGHEEIEIALIKLYRHTGNVKYFDMASVFVERRGRMAHAGWQILKHELGYQHVAKLVAKQRVEFEQSEGINVPNLPYGDAFAVKRRGVHRFLQAQLMFLNGKYNQQHVPARAQREVVGHTVRQGYYAAAMADILLETGDLRLRKALEAMWDSMTSRRMYVTGGVGCRSIVEAFGRDFELPNQTCYCETCAAVANMLWAGRMALATGEVRYADILEQILYNAFLVGMSQDGRHWSYTNPLEIPPDITDSPRREWFRTPCCPPNFARMLPTIGSNAFGTAPGNIWVHQYFGCETTIELGDNLLVALYCVSEFPWNGSVTLEIVPSAPATFTLNLRIPAWSGTSNIIVNGETIFDTSAITPCYVPLEREWHSGDLVSLSFDLAPRFVNAHPKVQENRGKVVITRGPLVYCVESADNPNIDLFKMIISRSQPLIETWLPEILGGIMMITGKTIGQQQFNAIPYFAWGNREIGPMRLWLPAK